MEENAPPIVRAIARDLGARLDDPAFAEATESLRGVVNVCASATPESVTLRLGDRMVSLRHGAAEDADLTVTAPLEAGEDGAPALEGGAEHPELAEWASALLDPSPPPLSESAERFWSVLSRRPGAPSALRVIDLDSDEERRYGSENGRAYEIQGPGAALTDVFTGRCSLMEAAFEGRVFVRGSFPEISILSGAGFAIRFGEVADDE